MQPENANASPATPGGTAKPRTAWCDLHGQPVTVCAYATGTPTPKCGPTAPGSMLYVGVA